MLIGGSVGSRAETKTFGDWVDRYVEVDPAIGAAKARMEESEFRVNEASGSFFPSVVANLSKLENNSADVTTGGGFGGSFSSFFVDTLYSAELALTQPIFIGGKLWAGLHLSQARRDSAKAEYNLALHLGAVSFVEKVVNWSLLQREYEAVNQSFETQKSYVNLTRRKVKRGTAKRYELDQNLSDLYSYETRLTQIQLRRDQLRKDLSEVLQWEEKDIATVNLPTIRTELPLNEAQLLTMALENRPDLIQAEKTVEAAQANRRLEGGDHLPSVSLSATYGYKAEELDQLGESGTDSSSVILGISIPLFSGFSGVNNLRANNKAILAAELNLEKVRRQVYTDVGNALNQFKTTQKLYGQAQRWKRSADKAFKGGDRNFKNGVIGNLQILTLQVQRERAAIGFIEAERAYQLAAAQLYAMVGKSPLELYRK